jgi:hypothetical protein
MLQKYLATLAIVVVAATYAVAFLPFAAYAAVLSGTIVDEHRRFELTLNGGHGSYYAVDPQRAQFLEENISLHTTGTARIVAANIVITPQSVRLGRARSVPGAAMTVELQWDTPRDASDGTEDRIYLDFPEIPGLEGIYVRLRSGSYWTDSGGGYVIREETTYRDPFRLGLARTFIALALGLPLGVLLHAVGWHLLVLQRERATRIAALPAGGSELPRTFYPDPVAEWQAGLIMLGVFASLPVVIAYSSDGFMSQTSVEQSYILVALGGAIAPVVAAYTGARVLTFRVEQAGISFARGREALQWTDVPWSDVTLCEEKTSRGRRWIEIGFKDQWRNLKIGEATIVDYAILLSLLEIEPPDT